MNKPLRLILILLACSTLAACGTTGTKQQDNGLWHPTATVPQPGPTPLGTPVPNQPPDKIVVATERTLLVSRDTFNFYIHFYKDNRATLDKASPKFGEFWHYLGKNSIGWLETAERLKEIYKLNSSDFNLQNLLNQLKLITDNANKAQAMTNAGNLTTP